MGGEVMDKSAAPRATPEQIAAAWRAFRGERKGTLIGPGPAFVEAIDAALAQLGAEPAEMNDDR